MQKMKYKNSLSVKLKCPKLYANYLWEQYAENARIGEEDGQKDKSGIHLLNWLKPFSPLLLVSYFTDNHAHIYMSNLKRVSSFSETVTEPNHN